MINCNRDSRFVSLVHGIYVIRITRARFRFWIWFWVARFMDLL